MRIVYLYIIMFMNWTGSISYIDDTEYDRIFPSGKVYSLGEKPSKMCYFLRLFC